MKDFHIISDDMLQLTLNIFIAAFTTRWARQKLYSLLELLGEEHCIMMQALLNL